MPLWDSYNSSFYWKAIKDCLNGETIVDVVSSSSDITNVVGNRPYVSCSISSSPFHAIADFTQSVKGFSVTTSRTSSYSKKRYYTDENGDLQSYIQSEASVEYDYTVSIMNTGLLGRFAFYFAVANGTELTFPSSPTQVDGWDRLFDLKHKITPSSSDDVGTWSYTTRQENGDETTESGEIRPNGRPSHENGAIYLLSSSPDTLYFTLADTLEGIGLRLYEQGQLAFPSEDHLWFAAASSSFANRLDAYDITNDPDPDLSSTTISSPTSGLNMEGLSIEGPRRLESDEEPENPVSGDIVRTYNYTDTQSLSWLSY